MGLSLATEHAESDRQKRQDQKDQEGARNYSDTKNM